MVGCVCQGHAWQGGCGMGVWGGTCMVGGMHGRGSCMTGGRAWQGGVPGEKDVHGRGDVCGRRDCTAVDGMHPTGMHSCLQIFFLAVVSAMKYLHLLP